MEEEWGKLIIEMLEREKSLRPAVERWVQSLEGIWHPLLGRFEPCPWLWFSPYFRLELLLQIANKIQNGALNCEEKLTLAKNTLQAVSLTALSHMFTSPLILCCDGLSQQWRDPASFVLELQWTPWLPGSKWVRAGELSPLLLSLSLSGCCSPGVRAAGAVWVRRHHVHSGVWRSHQTAAGGSPNPTRWELLPARRAGF